MSNNFHYIVPLFTYTYVYVGTPSYVVSDHFVKMAHNRFNTNLKLDPNAGYIDEDESDLEFSNCEESSG